MTDAKPNKVTVKTTGAFELRDAVTGLDIGQKPVETIETSFISQMVALKRLEVVSGKVESEVNPHEGVQNPSIGEALPTKDSEPTIKELQENRSRGRPKKSD